MPRAKLSARERKRRARRSAHNTHLKKTYGITILDYDSMFEAQSGKCRICRGGTSRNFLAVDHNHRNDRVRGLLCANCNKGLAIFRDSVERLAVAIQYLNDDGDEAERIMNAAKDQTS